MTASIFLFYNNFSSYEKNPAADLLQEYDRLEAEIANKKFSQNGLRYLNRLKLEISNRIAYRLKIKDCTEFFNEHPQADNGKYILYPNDNQNLKSLFLCEKNMQLVSQKKLIDLGSDNSGESSARMPAQVQQVSVSSSKSSIKPSDDTRSMGRGHNKRRPGRR